MRTGDVNSMNGVLFSHLSNLLYFFSVVLGDPAHSVKTDDVSTETASVTPAKREQAVTKQVSGNMFALLTN